MILWIHTAEERRVGGSARATKPALGNSILPRPAAGRANGWPGSAPIRYMPWILAENTTVGKLSKP